MNSNVASLEERRDAQRDRAKNSPHLASGTGGPHNPDMEARVAKLETDVGEIKSILGRMEPMLTRMDGEMRKIGQDVAEMKGRMATFATASEVAELKGRVSQLPTVLQMISFVLLVLGIAGILRFFAAP